MNKVFRTYLNACDRLAKPMAVVYAIVIATTYVAVAVKCKKEGRAFTKRVFSNTWSTLKSVRHN